MKTLSYWLSQTGEHELSALWGKWIESLLDAGAVDFAKVPVRCDDSTSWFFTPGEPQGERRALACPEPIEPGMGFALTWFDGSIWRMEHCDPLAWPTKASTFLNRARLLREAAESVPDFASFVFDLENRIEFNRKARPADTVPEWYHRGEAQPLKLDDLEAVFAAGVAYGRRTMRADQSTTASADSGPDWRAVINDAACRHGRLLKPVELALKMGANARDEDIPDLNVPGSTCRRRWYEWPSGITVDIDEFARVHGRWRDANPVTPKSKRVRKKAQKAE